MLHFANIGPSGVFQADNADFLANSAEIIFSHFLTGIPTNLRALFIRL
jgi:hypothetical protein